MSDETIVAIFDTPAHAELAAADLRQAGVPENAISVHASKTATTASAPREPGFWNSLFGGSPDHDTSVYERSVDDGASVLSVKTPNTHVARVLEIVESHGPIDIDERAVSFSQTPTVKSTATSMNTAAPRSDDMIQLSKENLTVDKRLVNRGGTRIRRFVVETPVEENVNLHSEKVVLERHPVTDGRSAVDSFSGKSIEMTETAEEAVVSKVARVYEEVGLRKETSDRVETVRDSVRKEQIEVEQIPGSDRVATKRSPNPVK